MWLSTRVGAAFDKRPGETEPDLLSYYMVILAATLSLLALIIGFSFSMAISRYDLRKSYEAAEANAIGTEYSRADLLPAADAAKVRALLMRYTDQRVLFYTTRDELQIRSINDKTAKLQTELWTAVVVPAAARPEPLNALAVSGMNDVLNAQAYTQAAWWNRIPVAAWALMLALAICSNLLVGFGARDVKAKDQLFLIIPFVVAVSFFLIADIDSPLGGIIRVVPQNLQSLVESLPASASLADTEGQGRPARRVSPPNPPNPH
jgi:hypothetical protein